METANVLFGMNQPESAIPRMARRPRLPIRMAAGITFLRCSILVLAKIGEMIPPTCCNASPSPTMVLEPEIWNRYAGRNVGALTSRKPVMPSMPCR